MVVVVVVVVVVIVVGIVVLVEVVKVVAEVVEVPFGHSAFVQVVELGGFVKCEHLDSV